MKRLALSRNLLLACLIEAAAVCGICHSVSAAEVADATVSYGDLNLSRSTDVQELYRRIQRAAASVCIPVPSYELARFAAYQRCVQVALEKAVERVGSPELLALYRAGGPKSRSDRTSALLHPIGAMQ